MDHQQMAEKLKEVYRQSTETYRHDDEIEARTDHHCWIWKTLADISASFDREISVLDAGCGTGRYFHCLQNVKRLVGADVSPEMLNAAKTPIRQHLVSAKKVELMCANIYTVTLPYGSFDLIYSIGMFGYGCPVTLAVLERFYEWLAPDGVLFFDVADVTGLPRKVRFKKRVRKTLYPVLPTYLQRRLDEREKHVPFFSFSKRDLSRTMGESHFKDFKILSRPINSPSWGDKKLECLASKGGIRPELIRSLEYRVLRSGGAAISAMVHLLSSAA